MEAFKLLLVGVAISESFCEETYGQLTVDNNDVKRKKLLCITEVPCLCVVHSIMTHICLLLATAHNHIVEQVLPGNYYWPTLVVTY